MYSIGKKIRYYREEKGYTQEKLAELVRISPNYLSAIERDVKIPKLETFLLIVNKLEVKADDILSDQLEVGRVLRANKLYDQICNLPKKEQDKILHVVETMLADVEG